MWVFYFVGRKKLHFTGTNFCDERLFTKRFVGISFCGSQFFFVDGIQPVVVGEIEVLFEVIVTTSGSAVNHLLLT